MYRWIFPKFVLYSVLVASWTCRGDSARLSHSYLLPGKQVLTFRVDEITNFSENMSANMAIN